MKKYISIILACLFVQLTWAQSGESYDPQNPGDPQAYYRLTVEASPKQGGSVSPTSMQQLSAGVTTNCNATANAGYKFKQWMVGDKVVSTESNFTYTMPEENVTLIAYFDWVGNDGYNPENPGDPFADGYQHKVTLYATPSAGGSFNSSSFYLTEGKKTNVYAYPSSGYRFVSWKQKGKIVSIQNPMEITMGTENLEYTAQFVYDPVNPGNPGANNFNAATGELVIDDFEAGRLSSAIYTTLGTDDNYNKVKSVTIIGTMQAGDFGFLRGMSNCSVVDISRTTGYNDVPNYAFEGSSALKTIILPYSVESIGNYAFSGCSNLTTLYCYATTPPSVSGTTFDGVSNSMKVLVPALSLELYQSANYWKDFVLSALDGVTNTLTISLPEDAKDGRYKNMTLELDNITSGQVSRMLITDRTRYSFVNLIHNTKYNVYVKTAKSVVLGEIQDVEIVDKDVETAFAQLKQPQTVTMSVVNGKGENLTESTDITWFDANGNYLATGNTIAGYVDGTVLKYRVKLSNDAALYYVAPQDSTYEIKASGNEFNCVLTPLQLVTVTGYVKNANTKKGIYDASVSISQQTSGKQSRTVVAKTDVNGKFTAEVYNSPASISCAAFDYVNKSLEVKSFTVADGKVTIDDVMMNSIVGATINLKFTYQATVNQGSNPIIDNFYPDINNVSYELYNLTTDTPIQQVSNRYPQLVILDGVKIGDRIRLTARSKTDIFDDVIVDTLLDNREQLDLTIAIKERGGFTCKYLENIKNDAVVGLLYKNGIFTKKYEYNQLLSINASKLKTGEYTLVTMGKNDAFNAIYQLSRLADAGLIENVDYVKNTFVIENGFNKLLEVSSVPFFNEAKFKIIDRKASKLYTNLSSVVAGNYLAYNASIKFLGDVVDFPDKVNLLIDIPDDLYFVDGSVMVGETIKKEYNYNNNCLEISLSLKDLDEKIKFCVVPTKQGDYTPNAFVKFSANNEDILIPITGSTYSVKNMDITVPKYSGKKSVVISGIAPIGAEMELFDNNVKIGSLVVPQSGTWSGSFELNNPYNLSSHLINAKFYKENYCIDSETKVLFYNNSIIVPEKVVMDYYGSKTEFDLINHVSTGYYYFAPSKKTFTFSVEFSTDAADKIKDVELYVFTSNKKYTKLNPQYSDTQKKWVVSCDFTTSNLPVNVSVKYDADTRIEFDEENSNKDILTLEQENSILENEDSVYLSWLELLEKSIYDDAISNDSLFAIIDSISLHDKHLLNEDEILIYNSFINEIIVSDPGDLDKVFDKYEAPKSEDYMFIEGCFPPKYGNVPEQIAGAYTTPVYNYYKKDMPTGDLSKDIPGGLWEVQSDGASQNNISFLNKTNGDVLTMNFDNQISDIGNGSTEELQESFSRLNSLCDSYLSTISTDGLSFDLIEQLCKERIDKLRPSESMYTRALNGLITKKGAGENVDRSVLKSVIERKKAVRLQINQASRIQNLSKIGGHVATGVGVVQLAQHIGESISASRKWDNLIKKIDEVCKESDKTNFINEAKQYRGWLNRRNAINGTGQVGCIGIDVLGKGAAVESAGLSLILPIVSFGINCGLDFWKANYNNTNEQNYNALRRKLSNSDKCDYEEDEPDEPETPDSKHGVDPSGYVYEGIFNNRIEGVTTTCYQKVQVEDMYGDLHDNIIKWDAEEYGQENPLHTDKDGFYQWFVPEGLWQVKYEKEGYETAYSEWLPVPPPQLDVNIGIVQNRQPEVKEAHAYEDGVELTFDKYMMPANLTTDNIKVSQNGKYVDGKVVLVDEEVAYRDENVKYASTVRFVPNNAFSAGKEVTLVVANRVKSYAGIQMADNFTQSFDIEKEVKSIVADSLVKVPYQGSKVITLYVQPADAAVGKTMHAESSSEMLASLVQKDVVIDDNGMAQFEIKGELPGTTGITFSIDGVKTTATVIANVGDFEVSAINEPKASLVSGSSVYRGTTVKLTADSKDLKIWYTIDGTCPCDENGSRKQYTEPIVINSDMTLKAIAENADGDASDVVTFVYSILQSKTGVSLADGWNWVSFNMKNDALNSVNTAMASGSWTSDDVVKDNKYVDMYSANQKQWIGTLSKHGALNNTQMYKVRSSKAQTLGLTGEAVHPAETAITLGAGWNYISYLPLVNMNVSDALKGYKAENGDVIKSQDAFATYSTDNGWEGDLTTMTVGRGYMLKRGVNASQVSFTYPVESFGSSVKAAAPAKSYRYADNMNIIGEVEGINVEDGDSLVAYVNGEIRGASRLERNHKVFLTIQGDEDAKVAMVLVRDGEIIATASNMIVYQSNNVLGTSDAPTAITFVTDDSRLDGNVGNVKAIYGINGIKMNTRRLNNIPSGTYIIYSEKNGNTCVTKFIK